MAQVINTNVLSLNAQRNLSKTGMGLAQALQRLSSGLRINSAKDDAAGLGITDRMTTQIRGLNQAVRNSQDGISLSQTSESALSEITNNLQRIRELAVQSSNATNSSADRAALNLEVQQRIGEVNRIASQTSFNGRKVLDGTFGSANFQVGANVGEVISVGLSTSMQSSSIGAYVSSASDLNTNSAGTVTADATALTNGAYANTTYTGVDSNPIDGGSNVVTINGTNVLGSASYAVSGDSYRAGDSAYAKAAAINATGISGVTASAQTVETFAPASGSDFLDFSSIAASDTVGYDLSINGVAIYDAATTGLFNSTTNTVSIADAVTAINAQQFSTGVVASTDSSGNLVLTAADGRNIAVDEGFTFTDGATAASDSSGTLTTAFSSVDLTDDTTASNNDDTYDQAVSTYRGAITLNSNANVSISAGNAIIGFTSATLSAQSSLEAQNVLTASASNNTIQSVDSALTAVSNLRSTFGAIQNRFESVVSNLESVAENLTASRSRILDADFAAETAALTRAQVLQQAGVAMLAQANAVPQSVLALLR